MSNLGYIIHILDDKDPCVLCNGLTEKGLIQFLAKEGDQVIEQFREMMEIVYEHKWNPITNMDTFLVMEPNTFFAIGQVIGGIILKHKEHTYHHFVFRTKEEKYGIHVAQDVSKLNNFDQCRERMHTDRTAGVDYVYYDKDTMEKFLPCSIYRKKQKAFLKQFSYLDEW